MVKSRDEILEIIRTRVGDDNSDETLSFIEDIADTMNDYESRLADSTNWKTRYEENDKEWRKKYKDRFFNEPVKDEEVIEEEITGETPKKFEDLFKED